MTTTTTLNHEQCRAITDRVLRIDRDRTDGMRSYDAELSELMGAPVSDLSEYAPAGVRADHHERLRAAYGERTTSTTTVGIGPVGTFGAFLGTYTVTDANGTRTELARSLKGDTLAGTRSTANARNAAKRVNPGRKATCQCGECSKCKTRARVARSRAKAKAKNGRTIADKY